jgi:hypothetical protein
MLFLFAFRAFVVYIMYEQNRQIEDQTPSVIKIRHFVEFYRIYYDI